MRTEAEMYDLILRTAMTDARILAVYMNGSRTNDNAVRDIFQDYDIVYVVEQTRPFIEDAGWIQRFGEILYMQCPEALDLECGIPCNPEENYGWLMQFRDGNRLDLHIQTKVYATAHIREDSLCRILLDKHGILPSIGESSERDYLIKPPTPAAFHYCCNEFWWCLNNVAKGLWRREISYVQDMLGLYIRPQLVRLLSWKIGIDTRWRVSIGKSGKYMYRYLEPDTWARFLSTYSGSKPEELWDSVTAMCTLFDETAGQVAKTLDFKYNIQEAKASMFFLENAKNLPQDATEVL